jgi:hypothetical protein
MATMWVPDEDGNAVAVKVEIAGQGTVSYPNAENKEEEGDG